MNPFCRFGLIVTGKSEECFLPRFFRVLPAHAHCTFKVIRRIGQRNPITSPRRKLRMVGRGQVLTTKDVEEIGLPARRFLNGRHRSFVVLVDDLEGDRGAIADKVFARYREALDVCLRPAGAAAGAAVHFLVNMLEAYYFADASAVNRAAGVTVLAEDYCGDVETIPHPKNELRALWSGFDELKDGERIIGMPDVVHVLDRPEHCCWLRAMFGWCVERLASEGAVYDQQLPGCFQLLEGRRAELTRNQ